MSGATQICSSNVSSISAVSLFPVSPLSRGICSSSLHFCLVLSLSFSLPSIPVLLFLLSHCSLFLSHTFRACFLSLSCQVSILLQSSRSLVFLHVSFSFTSVKNIPLCFPRSLPAHLPSSLPLSLPLPRGGVYMCNHYYTVVIHATYVVALNVQTRFARVALAGR